MFVFVLGLKAENSQYSMSLSSGEHINTAFGMYFSFEQSFYKEMYLLKNIKYATFKLKKMFVLSHPSFETAWC